MTYWGCSARPPELGCTALEAPTLNAFIRRWRALYLLVPLVAIVAALLVLVAASMETLSAGRAYVAGEGLWSKAQKDAVHHLLYYARTYDERNWQRYLEAIAVPLGDRKAREALDRPAPDYAAARSGFIEGRNHPEDVDAMARLFVRFRHVSYVARAIDIWAEGDRRIDELRAAASRLHAEVSGARDPGRIGALLEELHAVNAAAKPAVMQTEISLRPILDPLPKARATKRTSCAWLRRIIPHRFHRRRRFRRP